VARSSANLAAVAAWVADSSWPAFLAEEERTRSCTSICLKIVDPWFHELPDDEQSKAAKRVAALLDAEGVALDVGAYRDAPAGLRLWGGATVETADLEAVFPWLDWAFNEVRGGG
jgi:phosphoserine aminotransferase